MYIYCIPPVILKRTNILLVKPSNLNQHKIIVTKIVTQVYVSGTLSQRTQMCAKCIQDIVDM